MEASPTFGFKSVSDRLGWWNFYFIAKLVLFALGLIGFHLWENLAFATLLFAMASPPARRFRPWLGVPVAIALAYYDSWLPGLTRVASQAGLVASFSGAYLMELAGRFVSWTVVAVLAMALAVYIAIARLVRVDVFVLVAMVAMALMLAPPKPAADPTPAAADAGKAAAPPRAPDELLAEFFQQEAMRSVTFSKPPEESEQT